MSQFSFNIALICLAGLLLLHTRIHRRQVAMLLQVHSERESNILTMLRTLRGEVEWVENYCEVLEARISADDTEAPADDDAGTDLYLNGGVSHENTIRL